MSTQTVELRHSPTHQGGGYVQKACESIELVTHWEVVNGANNLCFAKSPTVGEVITLPDCGSCHFSEYCSSMIVAAGEAVVHRDDGPPYVAASATLRLPKTSEVELLSQLTHAVGRNGIIFETIYEFGPPLPCAGTSTFIGEIGQG